MIQLLTQSALRLIIGLAVLATLPACGGGNTSDGTGTPSPPLLTGSLPLLTVGRNMTSEVGGVILTRRSDGSYGLSQISGEIDHGNGALQLTSSVENFSDSSGPDSRGHWQSGNGSVLAANRVFRIVPSFGGSFDLVGSSASNLTYLGVLTPESFLDRTSGFVSFSGSASIDIASDSVGTRTTEGTANLTVSFNSGIVGVRITDFDDQAPFEQIVMRLPLEQNGPFFSGQEIEMRTNGGNVDNFVVGQQASGNAVGALFGSDDSGDPLGAGGIFTITGTTGEVVGVFQVQ